MAELTSILVGVLLVLIVAVVVRVIAAYVNEVVSPGVLVVIGVNTTVLGLDSGVGLSSRTRTRIEPWTWRATTYRGGADRSTGHRRSGTRREEQVKPSREWR